MAYVKGFEHDVFLSYCRVDNQDSLGIEWVTSFQKELQIILSQKTSKSASVWWDEKLPRNEDFNRKIKLTIESAACMVIVLTKNSIDSDYCILEREWFLSENESMPLVEKRIFIVMPDPLLPESKPIELRNLLGYEFWSKPDGIKSALRASLSAEVPPDCHRVFSSKITELADEIANTLCELTEYKEKGKLPPPRPKIFVADVTHDLYPKREEACAFLRQMGYSVLPAVDLYDRHPERYRETVNRELNGSIAFVQLLSDVSSGLPSGFPRLQVELAIQNGIPVFQWKREGIGHENIKDMNYLQLLDGQNVRACHITEFLNAVVACLVSAKTKVTETSENNRSIFIHSDTPDRRLAETAAEYLVKEGFDVDLGPEFGDPDEIRRELNTGLDSCDGLILVYAQGQPSWIRRQLQESRKVLAMRKSPPMALAVLDGPPPNKVGYGLFYKDWDVLPAHDWPNPERLRPFVERLRS